MVYPDEDLEKVGNLLYCKTIENNQKGCFLEASLLSSSDETLPIENSKGKRKEEIKEETLEEISQKLKHNGKLRND